MPEFPAAGMPIAKRIFGLPYNGEALTFEAGGSMISRRQFLEVGSVAGVAVVARPLVAATALEKPGDSSLPPNSPRQSWR